MASEFLATKYRHPPPAPHAIPRHRLTASIEAAIESARMVLVTAPAGYGKTTLLAQWARQSTMPVAWLTIDEFDNDQNRFLRSLLRAWETIQPDLRDTTFGVMADSTEPDRDMVMVAMVNAASRRDDHFAIALDDAHLIESHSTHDILAFLLDHGPASMHLVLASRSDPALPLGRLRASGTLLELHASDLAFAQSEAQDFFRKGMGLPLNEQDATILNVQMEGWAAGLQLAALTLRRHPGAEATTMATGNQRDIVDYLTEDVLAGLPPDIHAFLTQTCILDRLCHAVCVAVTGNPESQEMLDRLERANLFLMPLDDRRTWYRYHRVFADVLRQSLVRQGVDIPGLHRRAARWHLDNGLPELAIRHAIAAGDPDLACEVFEGHFEEKMFGGEVNVVASWLDALPDSWRSSRPELVLVQAKFHVLTGQLDAARDLVARLEHLPGQDQPHVRQAVARAEAVRCFMACYQNDLANAVAHSERAFRQLPASDITHRANLHHALGDTYRSHQGWDDARANYLKALELIAPFQHQVMHLVIMVHSYGALADLELRQGHLRSAAAFWTQALDIVRDRVNWGRFPLPLTGWFLLRSGELAYERNDLALAHDLVAEGTERAEYGGEPRSMVASRAIGARLAITDGNLDVAGTLLDEAATLMATSSLPDWAGRIDRHRVDLLLAQGNQRTALTWASSALPDITTAGDAGDERRLAVARVLVDAVVPGALDQSRSILDETVERSRRLGLDGVHVEALALRAITHDRMGNPGGMLVDLEAALQRAASEGYVRRLVDLGYPMLRLLREAKRREVSGAYVDTLLAAFGTRDPATGDTLPDPLSARETDVLRLLAAGLSNREIADQLFISPETVKKHTTSIYGKLGVRGRVEAVTRARSLTLLD